MEHSTIRELLLLHVPGVTADNIRDWRLLAPRPGDGVLRDATYEERVHKEMQGTARVAEFPPKSAVYRHRTAHKSQMITALTSGITLFLQDGCAMNKVGLEKGQSREAPKNTWLALATDIGGKVLIETLFDDKEITWEDAKYRNIH